MAGSHKKEIKKDDAKSNISYFQFCKDLDYPVYIRCDLSHFGSQLIPFLKNHRFEQLLPDQIQKLPALLKKRSARILNMVEATPSVVRQIDAIKENDRYGPESVSPQQAYRVYRYKNQAMIVYSFSSVEWQLGCFFDFGSSENEYASRSVINRFLGWALSTLGVVGFWGVPVDEGIVVMKQHESNAESVYIDIARQVVITVDGVKKIKGRFKILRLDPTLKGRNIAMTTEELLSFLSFHCNYFDYIGPSVPVRQMITSLPNYALGLVHPKESFKPRTDLSL